MFKIPQRNRRFFSFIVIAKGAKAEHQLRVYVTTWEERYTGPEGGWEFNLDIVKVTVDTCTNQRQISQGMIDKYIHRNNENFEEVQKNVYAHRW